MIDVIRKKRPPFTKLVQEYELESFLGHLPGVSWDKATKIAAALVERFDIRRERLQ